MAAQLLRGSSSPDSNSRSSSRPRHHVRTSKSKSRSSRRAQNEQYHHSRSSPPRQRQWSAPSHMMATTTVTTPQIHAPISVKLAQNGITVERTPSGNSIMSEPPSSHLSHQNTTLTYRDCEAARRVEYHFHTLPSDGTHERILRKLIRRDHPLDDSSIDDIGLASILNSANAVFFGGVLARRVQWEWSSQARYHSELIGTTALRWRPDNDGFETLIVLSEPILRSEKYDRRLLLSAFLHELIHCYLFIMCGFDAKKDSGHTKGFHAIAEIIDHWVGPGYLSLCNMKANLSHFRKDDVVVDDERFVGVGGRERMYAPVSGHGHEGCNQSPRPESGLEMGGVLDLRTGFY